MAMRWRMSLLHRATMTALLLWVVAACADNDRLQKVNEPHQNFDDAKLTPLPWCPVSSDMDQSKIMDTLNESTTTKKIVMVRGATSDSTITESEHSMRSEADADIIMYMIDPDDTSLTRLNKTTAKKYAANRLPDGRRLNIVWSANGWWIQSINYALYESYNDWVCSLDGKKAVFEDAASTSTVSPSSGNESDDVKVRTEAGTKKLKGTNSNDTDESEPAFSPDSEKLAFVRDGDLYVAYADGSEQSNLTNSGAEEYSPVWWPDNEKIAFAKDGDIYTINPDGTGLIQLTNNAHIGGAPIISPDGKKIAFAGQAAGGSEGDGNTDYDLYLIDADGGDLTNLTSNITRSDEATGLKVTVEWLNLPFLQPFLFSPDSEQIAFVRSSDVPTKKVPLPTSEYDLYAVNVDGTDLTRLTYDEIPKHIVTWVWN
jgi:Tol biopolymer transport system component